MDISPSGLGTSEESEGTPPTDVRGERETKNFPVVSCEPTTVEWNRLTSTLS